MAVYEEFKAEKQKIDMGNDSVVIRQYIGGITGGRALDYSDFTDEVIQAGHIIERKLVDSVYEYKPLKTSEGKYEALDNDYEYAGVTVRSRLKGEGVAIMDNGRVNEIAMPYQFKDDAQRKALAAALPNLIFEHD